MSAPSLLRVHPTDTVAVAVHALDAGVALDVEGLRVTTVDAVPAGHKVALVPHAVGDAVVKYGFPIGRASAPIAAGAHIHSHNLRTALNADGGFAFHGAVSTPTPAEGPTWQGFRRANGRVGTRNELWVVNTVACVNRAAERIARMVHERFGPSGTRQIDGAYHFAHPYGCSQLGDDLTHTRAILAGLIRHPNAGGVLVLGLGCENNQLKALLAEVGDAVPAARLRYFAAQLVEDEVEAGFEAATALVAEMATDVRTEVPARDLVLGLKCGGSDGFSGLTANPLVGRVADLLTHYGGRALLTEVPEMFGAEQVLLDRTTSRATFDATVNLVQDFKQYFVRHEQPVYENPSPGNKDGGLTTLEEKSLGAIQKGGTAPVQTVLRYGQPLPAEGPPGLALLEAPGNDGVSATALVASGATLVLFTTGRGTPLGFPAPTVKIASNPTLAAAKPHWIDYSAGDLLTGDLTMDALAERCFAYLLDVASGYLRTNNERNDYREIAIWKSGVTL